MNEDRAGNPAQADQTAGQSGPQLSRRTFLRLTAAGAGAVVLGSVLEACKGAYVPSAVPSTGPTKAAASAGAPASSTSANVNATGFPDLVVASDGEPEALVRTAMAALGGMSRFVPKGASVIVKPNICVADRSYDLAATTNPWVVGTVVKMAFEAGASSVKVFDNPFSGTAEDAYETSGIGEQVRAAGGQMVLMSQRGFVTKPVPDSKWLEEVDIYEEILNADVVINVPLVKDHALATMTAGLKNMMGMVAYPAALHIDLETTIPKLYSLIKPDLTIVDCVRVLTANGPEGGDPAWVKKLDKVVAGTDGVAADTYVCRFLDLKPESLPYLAYAESIGLGHADLSKISIKEVSA